MLLRNLLVLGLAMTMASPALAVDPVRPQTDRPPIRALLLTGGHEYESSFHAVFEGHPELAGMMVGTSQSSFQSDLRAKYDVLIFYDFSRELDEKGKQNLRAFVESGKGVVVLHHAILSYQKWPWWYEEVVGGRYRLEPEGSIPASSAKDGQELSIAIAGRHPVTAGLSPFQIRDEPYRGMWISSAIKPLLTTDHSQSDSVVAWIGPSPKYRAVYIQLGHGRDAFRHPAYRTLVHNAILWAASGNRSAD
jgi:type 1 glutamine amidotransferase